MMLVLKRTSGHRVSGALGLVRLHVSANRVVCGAGLLHMVCGSTCSAYGRSDLPASCGGTVGFCGAPVCVLLCRGASLCLVHGDVGPMERVRVCGPAVWKFRFADRKSVV